MRRFMRTTVLLVLTLLAGASALQAQVSIGIRIGAPPAERVLRVQPRAPGAGYVWVGGYWYPVGRKYTWHDGYWTRPPYDGATWVAPRHDGHEYFQGYWTGDKGRIEHDHKSDRRKTRDDRR